MPAAIKSYGIDRNDLWYVLFHSTEAYNIGNIGGVDLMKSTDSHGVTFFLCPESKLLHSIRTTKITGKVPSTVSKDIDGILMIDGQQNVVAGATIKPNLRGKGIGKQMYLAALEQLKIIRSGDQQTPKSRAIWLSFARSNSFSVRVKFLDDPNNQDAGLVFEKNGRLISAKTLNDVTYQQDAVFFVERTH